MSLCLKCQKEYSDDSILECPSCGVYLVDAKVDFSDDTLKPLKNVGDFFEANSITSLLSSVGIQTFTEDAAYGSTLKLYTGNENFYGKDIYVLSCMYDIAKEIIDSPIQVEYEDNYIAGEDE